MTNVIIDKEQALQANQDPFGRVWTIIAAPGTNLYRLAVLEEDGRTVLPSNFPVELKGLYTNRNRCEKVLNPWLQAQWTRAEHLAEKQARKDHAEKVKAKEDKDKVA